MSDLVKRLRIKAGMIEMGEMIAWGSDAALMREAADALEMAAPDHIAGARKMVAAAAQGVGSRPLPANRYGVDCNYFTEKLEILIRDMGNYTPAELARSLGRLAMTANSETMREPEFNTAPAVQGGGAVGWQFYQDGKWWHGDDRIKDHRKNTEEAGYPTRDVYAAPQPAEQKPDVTLLLGLLEHARCNTCDGSGGFYDNHGNPHQCQWCHDRSKALAAHRKQGGES